MTRTILILAAAGALALSGCGSDDSSTSPDKGTPTAVKVDTEDPTPDTPGRMTIKEEQTVVEVAEEIVPPAVEGAMNMARVYGWDEAATQRQADRTVMDYMVSVLPVRGVDIEDVKRRDAEATADGFPVDRDDLPNWRKAEGTLVSPEEAAEVAAENSEFDNPEELRDESTEEICPPGSDYRC